MSDGSKIEWTDATWNVVIGCDKVSPGCDNCYAIRTAHRLSANPNERVAAAYAGTEADGEWTGQVNLIHDRLGLPFQWGRPRKVFVNAQSDLFHKGVPDEFVVEVWAVMALAEQHTFQILTKRPGRMHSLIGSRDFRDAVMNRAVAIAEEDHSPAPRASRDAVLGRSRAWRDPLPWPLPNVWLGVSAEDQQRLDLRAPLLANTPAAARFVSAEPLLGPLVPDARHYPIDWMIVGGESGPGARPMHPQWVREARDACVLAGIAFHFKQWGEWAPAALFGSSKGVEFASVPIAPGSDSQHGMQRVGKRVAGRMIDGRTWDEYPA